MKPSLRWFAFLGDTSRNNLSRPRDLFRLLTLASVEGQKVQGPVSKSWGLCDSIITHIPAVNFFWKGAYLDEEGGSIQAKVFSFQTRKFLIHNWSEAKRPSLEVKHFIAPSQSETLTGGYVILGITMPEVSHSTSYVRLLRRRACDC